ncbi:hypothetical protein RAS1_36280 [Phycisphaerae bacterium RAS1]|nr:hypothetical protein RAS1_36280 [Phycisphaerae bacterium RAS1]
MLHRLAAHEASTNDAETPASRARASRVLILEPDALSRWSLSAYLRRWFDARVTASPEEAVALLGTFAVDALIVSDEVDADALRRIESIVRRRSPGAVMIRTVTHLSESPGDVAGWLELEKPFNLARLAELLGVAAPGSPGPLAPRG